MAKFFSVVGPALLACALAIGSFLICARIFHVPPLAVKVAATVIIAVSSLALLVGVLSAAKSRAKATKQGTSAGT